VPVSVPLPPVTPAPGLVPVPVPAPVVSVCVLPAEGPLVVPPLLLLPPDPLFVVESVLLVSPELHATANSNAFAKITFFIALHFTFLKLNFPFSTN
jgi:hypothetical protein